MSADTEDAAEKAYNAALRAIAKVEENGSYMLDLSGEEFRALDRLPPEVERLSQLRQLSLDHTSITDISRLSALRKLHNLSLGYCPEVDIHALSELTKLELLDLSGSQITALDPIAGLAHLRYLDFSHTAAKRLPMLASVEKLRTLYAGRTAVEDISPLSAATELSGLSLADCPIPDLSPLIDATRLTYLDVSGTKAKDLRQVHSLPFQNIDVFRNGLHFANTPACAQDAELARLSQIEDAETRTRETLAYLNSLPPYPEPYTPKARGDGAPPQPIGPKPTAPEPDPALPLIWGEEGFQFLAGQVDADPVAEAILADLRPMLEDLKRTGNRHDDLFRIAIELQDRCAGAVAELNLLEVHLSFQKLRNLFDARTTRSEPLDGETEAVVQNVITTLPGLTLADGQVSVLLARLDEERGRTHSAQQKAAAEAMLQKVSQENAPFTPVVKGIAQDVLNSPEDNRLGAARQPLARNVTIAVLTHITMTTTDAAIGGPVGNFVYDHGSDLLAYAMTMGDDAFVWAQAILTKFRAEYQLVVGAAAEALRERSR